MLHYFLTSTVKIVKLTHFKIFRAKIDPWNIDKEIRRLPNPFDAVTTQLSISLVCTQDLGFVTQTASSVEEKHSDITDTESDDEESEDQIVSALETLDL